MAVLVCYANRPAPNSTRSTGFRVIWVCISSSFRAAIGASFGQIPGMPGHQSPHEQDGRTQLRPDGARVISKQDTTPTATPTAPKRRPAYQTHAGMTSKMGSSAHSSTRRRDLSARRISFRSLTWEGARGQGKPCLRISAWRGLPRLRRARRKAGVNRSAVQGMGPTIPRRCPREVYMRVPSRRRSSANEPPHYAALTAGGPSAAPELVFVPV